MSDFRDLEQAIKRALTRIGSPKVMKEVGDEVAEMVRKRTRLGYGVEGDGKKRKRLKPLAESTKKVRAGKLSFRKIKGKTVPLTSKEFAKPKGLSQFTTANRSNLTETGQMLDSYKTVSISRNKAVVGPTGRRSDGLSNEEVAEFAEKSGRPFSYLTDVENKRLISSVRKRIQAIAQAILTKL